MKFFIGILACMIGCSVHQTTEHDTPSRHNQVVGTATTIARSRLHHRDPRRLLSMDHHLVQADFIGEVRVAAVDSEPRDKPAEVSLISINTRHTRWSPRPTLTMHLSPTANLAHMIRPGAHLVVMVSGGPWIEMPFTYGKNSVFLIADDNSIRCVSGNPVFAVHNSGFWCSTPDRMPTRPVTLAAMREQTIAMRRRAAGRLPDLESLLVNMRRPLEASGSEPDVIDRSRPENEVYR